MTAWRNLMWLLLRWVLGGLFFYAGLLKTWDAASLAASITRFQIVPEWLVHPMALALPALEIICGLALVAGPWKRQAAFGIALLCTTFLLALVSAGLHGIAVDCACFGGTTAEPLWKLIFRDLLLLAAAGAIYLKCLRQESLLVIPDAAPVCAKSITEVSPLSRGDEIYPNRM